MNPRILVVIGTPIAGSLNHSLAASYIDAARAGGAEVRVIDLANDPIPAHPTSRDELRMPRTDADRPLDPEVAAYIDDVRWADRLVFFHPQWWGTYPAALKAFIDRVFLSGFAFRYRERSALSERLLAGRTARIVMTMDSPRAWNRLVYRNAAETSMTKAILSYCGVRTTGITRFTPVRFAVETARADWVAQTAKLGARDAAATVARASEPVPA
ncbi:MAG TPA: NAD(P)H-dependent oxidoreductase [Microbacterium sp.]|nr:NAD(P)H-dependent oxidoreductase [Microbacterium sp.]